MTTQKEVMWGFQAEGKKEERSLDSKGAPDRTKRSKTWRRGKSHKVCGNMQIDRKDLV